MLSIWGFNFLTKMSSIEQKSFQRQVAYKVRISDILNGSFIKDELSAGYIKLNDANVSRINIIATVVYKAEQPSTSNALIDDGTGKILLRSFENSSIFSKVDVGDAVLMIGKIREFNNERYIVPEILKKINNIEWMNVRKLEVKDAKVLDNKIKNENNNLIEEVVHNSNEDIFLLIKKLDKGEGVSVEEIINEYNNGETEGIINKLLENGDIFEVKPGKLKVLE